MAEHELAHTLLNPITIAEEKSFEQSLRPQTLRPIYRPAEGKGQHLNQHPGRPQTAGSPGSRAAVWPSGTGQNHARDHHRQ